MQNPGVGQDLTGLATAVQLRLRVAIGLQTLIVKSRLLTGENSVRIEATQGGKPLSAMHLLGKQASLVQFRVGAPVLVTVCQGGRPPGPQSSQRSSRFHKPALPRAALGIATI
jgi:hypothetical protein